MAEILKNRKSRLMIILSTVVILLAVFAVWMYYKNTQVFDQYSSSGEVIGYENTDRGLVVVLRVKENPYHVGQTEIKLMIDEETVGLQPDLVYMMKERILGGKVQFSSRAFWLPDAKADIQYIFPMKGGVLESGTWFDLLEAGHVDEVSYDEYLTQYTSKM